MSKGKHTYTIYLLFIGSQPTIIDKPINKLPINKYLHQHRHLASGQETAVKNEPYKNKNVRFIFQFL